MSETTEIALLPDPITPAIFQEAGRLDAILAEIKAKVDAFEVDATTASGRKDATSFAYKITRSKTALDEAGAKLVEEAKKTVAEVDAERRRVRGAMDAMRDTVRAPIERWEAQEAERVARLNERLAALAAPNVFGWAAADIKRVLIEAEGVRLDTSWQERFDDAKAAKEALVAFLTERLEEARAREEAAAELDRLRQAAAERLKADQEAEVARRAAEKAAEREKAEQERQNREEAARAAAVEAAREQAKREEAEKVAQAEARQRHAEQQAEEAKAAAARAAEEATQREKIRAAQAMEAVRAKEEAMLAQKRRQAALRKAIAAGLEAEVTGLSAGAADAVAAAIIAGKIPHVKVTL